MKNYKTCPRDQYEAAMAAYRSKTPVEKLPDQAVYIIYTKLQADAKHLSSLHTPTPYSQSIASKSANNALIYRAELQNRGILTA